MDFKFKFRWFLIALVWGLIINETNLYFVKKENPSNIELNDKSTVNGFTIWSIDNSWYVNQIKNLKDGLGFTIDPAKPHYFVRRSPGYPMFFGLHYLLFGERFCYLGMRITQLLMAALSVILLGMTVVNFTNNIAWARWSVRLFALSPFLVINSYYTLTEAVTPFWIISSFYLFSVTIKRNGPLIFFITGLSVGFMVLTRPILLLMIPVMLVVLLYLKWSDIRIFLKGSIFLCFGVLMMMSPWVIRNYYVTKGEIIFLEKFYNEDPMDFGKGHIYFRSWLSCWTNINDAYSAEVFSMKLRHSSPETRPMLIKNYINNLPPYLADCNMADINDALWSLANCFEYKDSINKLYTDQSEDIIPPCEEEVKKEFINLSFVFKHSQPLRYYVITPINIFKEMALNSYSYAYGSLNPLDKKFSTLQIVFKSIMYFLNAMLYLSFFIVIFYKSFPLILKIPIVLFNLLTIFFFAYYLRYAELRYMLPIYPFLYICLAFFIQKWFNNKSAIIK